VVIHVIPFRLLEATTIHEPCSKILCKILCDEVQHKCNIKMATASALTAQMSDLSVSPAPESLSEFEWAYDPMNERLDVRENELSNLCQICTDLFRGPMKAAPSLAPDVQYDVGQTLSELSVSSKRGCYFCFRRWNQLSPANLRHIAGCQSIRCFFYKSQLVFYYFPPNGGRKLVKEFTLQLSSSM
jgi:hypothetical protein